MNGSIAIVKGKEEFTNLTEMLKGALEGCILEIISRKETYGYEIMRLEYKEIKVIIFMLIHELAFSYNELEVTWT